jgi:hypothetical protein
MEPINQVLYLLVIINDVFSKFIFFIKLKRTKSFKVFEWIDFLQLILIIIV